MKLSISKTLALGIAAGAISMAGVAQAQTTADPMMPPAMAAPMAPPMPVSGTVLRYYTDGAGYVSAMDVQAADGVKMVGFSPSMAQNLTTMYPVGSTASVYVNSMMMGGMTSYTLAGMGPEMPMPMSTMPMMPSALATLKSTPYTTIGAKAMRVKGKLSSYIVDPMSGQVLALVLDNKTLVRVPFENRLPQSSKEILGTTPLLKNADIVAYGLPEAPKFGAVSPYDARLIASSISVNGKNLSAYGFGTMKMRKASTLIGLDIPFIGGNPKMESADNSMMGYTPYMAPGTMMPGDAMTPPPAM